MHAWLLCGVPVFIHVSVCVCGVCVCVCVCVVCVCVCVRERERESVSASSHPKGQHTGNTLETVEAFSYLGSEVRQTARVDGEVHENQTEEGIHSLYK